MNTLFFTVLIGIGATAVMDIWSLVRKAVFGIPVPNYGLVGRWIAHMRQGHFHHDSIAAAAAVPGELLIGWVAHYLIGVAFAGILIGIWGVGWLSHPTLGPAILVSIVTLIAPFLLMQPGMGAGIAASRTPRPTAVRVQSIINHVIFGFGLYLTGQIVRLVASVWS